MYCLKCNNIKKIFKDNLCLDCYDLAKLIECKKSGNMNEYRRGEWLKGVEYSEQFEPLPDGTRLILNMRKFSGSKI